MAAKDKIKELREKLGLTQEDVAKALSTKKQTIYKYEKGKITNIPLDRVEKLAELFGVDPQYITGWHRPDQYAAGGILQIEKFRIPYLGTIKCGEPTCSGEEFEGYVEVGIDIKADFALRAHGDSMVGARINDGDVVFIRKQEDVQDGEIAAVILDDETTLKRVYKFPNGTAQLRAENPKYPPINIGGDNETRNVRILGKAVAFQGNVI